MRWTMRIVPAVLLAGSLLSLMLPRGAETVPLYAARTGLMCQNCHFDPNGGGQRNDFGFSYARNRHDITPEDSTSEWASLEIVNRVVDNVPIYFGLNHRLLLLANSTVQSDSLDRFAFFGMENAIHIAFQPHRRLALVHSRDGDESREAFGWIGGFPLDGYVKLGSFRNPFGLRMDDHTTATRNGFLDFYVPSLGFQPYASLVSERFLPYDPREVDHGIEVGGSSGPFYGRLAFTNGRSFLFGGGGSPLNPYAETKTIKLGYNMPWYQGGLSFYDDYQKEPLLFDLRRHTRWGYYGLTHMGPVALLGEIAAGTDEAFGGEKTNLLAAFGELDWSATRAVNVRLRYDYMNLNRDQTDIGGGVTLAELNTHHRFSLEGEWVPVPFAELRWTLRYIDHAMDVDPLGAEIDDERQAYLQAHFSY